MTPTSKATSKSNSINVKTRKWHSSEHLEIEDPCLSPLDSDAIKAIRSKYKLSQAVLARILNVGLGAVRQWEQGQRNPNGSALKLLHMLDQKGIELLL